MYISIPSSSSFISAYHFISVLDDTHISHPMSYSLLNSLSHILRKLKTICRVVVNNNLLCCCITVPKVFCSSVQKEFNYSNKWHTSDSSDNPIIHLCQIGCHNIVPCTPFIFN